MLVSESVKSLLHLALKILLYAHVFCIEFYMPVVTQYRVNTPDFN